MAPLGITGILVAVIGIAIAIRLILKSPFTYPYYTCRFDVSGKRKVNMVDCIDELLLDRERVLRLYAHQCKADCWKRDAEKYLQTCWLKKFRRRQYRRALDDEREFRFIAIRKQTRYRQRNYVKESYKVTVEDDRLEVSWEWIQNRLVRLSDTGFEATLKDYHAKNQRKLMTPALRRQIMERDNYTCQICGKYMPDQIGLQIDHIVPVAKGGKTVPSNLQVLCNRCNGRKGSR
jgi:5-methylcytosine-specific restriction endonuclease McrA